MKKITSIQLMIIFIIISIYLIVFKQVGVNIIISLSFICTIQIMIVLKEKGVLN